MPVLNDFHLTLDADQVLRAQGADPAIARRRSPQLLAIAERMLAVGQPLLAPQVLFRQLEVEAVRHEKLILSGGMLLSGKLIAQHLAAAERVTLILCTIGSALEEQAAEMASASIVNALALEGVGSAAVEALANVVCHDIEQQALQAGMQATIPLSPGMVNWPIEQGQPQIFDLLEAAQVGVTLTPGFMMLPRKSLTMVIGIGPNVLTDGRTCDYCNMRETCRYQEHYSIR